MQVAIRPERHELVRILGESLYPGAHPQSIELVIGYCEAAGLDPLQKPVHIVPMWDRSIGRMRDVVMPGVGLYRTQASRTGQYAGMSEPEFGPEVTKHIGGQEITFPEWAKVTVKRQLASGHVAEFTAVEYWVENYAVKGGKEKSVAPNAMWSKRPRGQLAKCASAQALRIAFPELGAAPTAEEMEGRVIQQEEPVITPSGAPVANGELLQKARDAALGGRDSFKAFFRAATAEERASLEPYSAELTTAYRAVDAASATTVEPTDAPA